MNDDLSIFDDLAEGGVLTAGIRIACFIDADGDPAVSYECRGSDELVTWLAALEYTKLQMFDRRYDRHEEAPDA
jgi:hypothetical protein